MSHKADKSFFERKRNWSKRKDHILAYYLEPYLAKVATLRRPILIVDGFAGPGKFGDGEIGSPLLICAKALKAIQRGARIEVRCIEQDGNLLQELESNLAPFSFASASGGEFLDHVPEISKLAATHTVFLYIDPFTVEGLNWNALDSVFQHVQHSSIELLLNFNAPIFVRCGLAALRRIVPQTDPKYEDPEEIDAPLAQFPPIERLDRIVGGAWWQQAITEENAFARQIERVRDGLCDRLRERFREVGHLAIKAKSTDRIPKYYLMFASGHIDGLALMNDAMVKTRGESIFCLDLFSESELVGIIHELSVDWIRRGELVQGVIRKAFCMFAWKEIGGCIETLLRSGELLSRTGKVRINNEVPVRSTRLNSEKRPEKKSV